MPPQGTKRKFNQSTNCVGWYTVASSQQIIAKMLLDHNIKVRENKDEKKNSYKYLKLNKKMYFWNAYGNVHGIQAQYFLHFIYSSENIPFCSNMYHSKFEIEIFCSPHVLLFHGICLPPNILWYMIPVPYETSPLFHITSTRFNI